MKIFKEWCCCILLALCVNGQANAKHGKIKYAQAAGEER